MNDSTGWNTGAAVRDGGHEDENEDPRVTSLRTAVARLRRELAGYRVHLSDREVAEEELAALAAAAAAGVPRTERLRGSLLRLSGALGSVSALAPALGEVRRAIDLFGAVPAPGSAPVASSRSSGEGLPGLPAV